MPSQLREITRYPITHIFCQIRLWDIETETPLHTFEGGHKNWVLCVQWSPDGQYFASGGMDDQVCIWNYTSQEMCGRPLKGHTKWITSLAWEPLHLNQECSILASSSKDGTVRLWSRPNNCCLLTITAHLKCVTKYLHHVTNRLECYMVATESSTPLQRTRQLPVSGRMGIRSPT